MFKNSWKLWALIVNLYSLILLGSEKIVMDLFFEGLNMGQQFEAELINFSKERNLPRQSKPCAHTFHWK